MKSINIHTICRRLERCEYHGVVPPRRFVGYHTTCPAEKPQVFIQAGSHGFKCQFCNRHCEVFVQWGIARTSDEAFRVVWIQGGRASAVEVAELRDDIRRSIGVGESNTHRRRKNKSLEED
ncbi:MAG: hypothetical protein ABSE73_02085 [Planctomycetota bacterium]